METKILSFYLGQFNIYGIEILNFDMESKERGVFCITWSPKVAIWIDIFFIRTYIEL